MGGRSASVTGSPVLAAGLGLALTVAAVVTALVGAPPDDKAIAALAHGLLVAAPWGVGVAVLARRPGDRFARVLLATAVVWTLTALQQTDAAVTYSLGRVAFWVAEVTVVYTLLAFPSGRLTTALERWTVRVMGLLVAVLYLPSALIVERYPEPSAGVPPHASTPENAFNLTPHTPGLFTDVIRPAREILTVAIVLLVVGILLRRTRRAGPMLRSALIPVAAVATFRAFVYPVYFVERIDHPDSAALETLTWVFMLAVALIPLSFGAGLLIRRLYGAAALQAVALRLRADSTAGDLRDALAVALEDPTLRILYWRPGEPGRWIDETGWPASAPRPGPDRQATEIIADGRRVAALEYDAAPAQDPEVIRAAGAYAVIVLDNRRLVEELEGSVHDLSASRARIAAVADEARRRIERDLHDGAQQRLVALRIKLARESERAAPTSPETAARLDALGDDVEATIDEVRTLAHGIYPSLLAERGLPDALRAAAISSPIPTSVAADGVGRYAPEVESTVYFACLEAMQNAAKHAQGATHVDIALSNHGALDFTVTDDGAGFEDGAEGTGLTNLRDRLIAVGGAVTVEPAFGGGTRVHGVVPVAAGHA